MTTNAPSAGPEIKRWPAQFLWFGPAPWEDRQPAHQVTVGQYIEVPGRDPIRLEDLTLSAEDAAAMGYPVSALVEGFNSDLFAAVTGLADENRGLREEIERLTAALVEKPPEAVEAITAERDALREAQSASGQLS